MKKLWCVVMVLMALGCTDEHSTRRALDAEGMTEVEVTGYDYWACGGDDWFHTGFTATNPQGRRVDGVVCCGLVFKNCTVRW